MIVRHDIKKVLLVLIGIVIMFCAGCGLTVAYADDSPFYVPQADSANPSASYIKQNGRRFGSAYSNAGYTITDPDTTAAVFYVNTGNSKTFVIATKNEEGHHSECMANSSSPAYRTFGYSDSTLQIYYYTENIDMWTLVGDINAYPNLEAGLTAANNYLLGVTPEPEPGNNTTATLQIPAGYVAWIYQNPADNVMLTQTLGTKVRNQTSVNMPKGQYWYRTNDTPIGNSMTNQHYPLSGMVPITWTKAPNAKTDALGLFNEVVSSDINIGSGSKIVIYNPYYFEAEQMLNQSVSGETKVNSSIYITGSWYKFDIYPVDEQFSNNNGEWSTNGTPTVNDDGRAQYIYDETSGQWILSDAEGNPIGSLPTGGGNLPNISNENNGIIATIKESINAVLERIEGMFDVGHGAIGTLVNLGRNFVSMVQGLYLWLPPPVLNLLTSALIVVICIGVFKVFL